MATWQFWMLFTVLVLILFTLLAVLDAVKSLWSKLHDLQKQVGYISRSENRD